MTNFPAFVVDDLPQVDRTHFNVLTADDVLVTVSVAGSASADGSDRSLAEANVMGLRFPNAAAGLRFKDAVQLADMDDLRMLLWRLCDLPGQGSGTTTVFATDLLT